MKKKGWFVLIFLLVFVGSVEAFKWSELGRAPLMPAIEDKISLQEKFSSYRGDILEGLRMAEPTWNGSEIFQSLETAIRSDRAVTETFFGLGQRFEWMIFRPQGRVGIVRNVEWAGKENLEGFLIAVAYKNERLKFFIAKRCGNLALVEKKPAPPPPKAETPPPPRVQAPPSAPPLKAEIVKPESLVSVSDEKRVFIRIFFLALPPRDDSAREVLRKDPRAIEKSTFQILNDATMKMGREGRFLLKLFTSENEGPAAFVAEVRVKGVGMWSAGRDFLQQYSRYEIWPDEQTMTSFFWPPSGWQKGEVSEFLRARIHHRVFITY
jgi:hypothetical protein